MRLTAPLLESPSALPCEVSLWMQASTLIFSSLFSLSFRSASVDPRLFCVLASDSDVLLSSYKLLFFILFSFLEEITPAILAFSHLSRLFPSHSDRSVSSYAYFLSVEPTVLPQALPLCGAVVCWLGNPSPCSNKLLCRCPSSASALADRGGREETDQDLLALLPGRDPLAACPGEGDRYGDASDQLANG